MRGFLRRADADLVLLPASLPVIGGQPLSTLFRRGLPPGSCPAGDDREQHGGDMGWWFYFALAADAVTLAGP
jgi:hypothetical protein